MGNKKLLLVEDELNILKMLEKELSSSVEITRVRAVDEALGAVEEGGPFDCFVVDLQIVPLGLSFKEMTEYQDREGYAFLKKYWEGKDEKEVLALKSKTIICSGFIPSFKAYYQKEISGLTLIDKTKGFESKVVSKIRTIIK